eukprot:m.342016 g.342016  ORF g.342016 m.342016 type:complete len:367 (-) comp20819_c0_seq1:98-1198(-)
MSSTRLKWKPVPLHFKIPHGLFLHEATAVSVNSKDEVFVFNRGNMPVLVFDKDGNLIRHWGNATPYEGTMTVKDPYGNEACRWIGTEYVRPHSVRIDHMDNVWLVDDMANTITKCDPQGKKLLVIGSGGMATTDPSVIKGLAGRKMEPAITQSGIMFNRPTDVAVHQDTGEIFISDGYGNSRVHRLTSDGTHIKSWGAPGTDEGQFNIPHNIAIHPDKDKVIVVDRENSRVQLFTLDGEFVSQWHIHRAVSVCTATFQGSPHVLVAEQGATSRVQKGEGYQISELKTWTPNIGHRIGVYTPEGKRVATLGASRPGERPDQFNWLHSVAVNSKGDIYAAEVSFCECGRLQKPHARELVSLRRWNIVN